MKKLSASAYPPASLQSFGGTSKIPFSGKKVKEARRPSPPNEETLARLNAMAREYPFCIMYKERNNDPL